MEIRFEFPIAYDSRCLQTNSVAVDMGSLVIYGNHGYLPVHSASSTLYNFCDWSY